MKKFKHKEKKLPLGISEEFLAEISSAQTDDLKSRIVAIQKDKRDSEVFLKENDKIVQKKEELKEMEGPARDTIKALNNRTKHILDILKERGAL